MESVSLGSFAFLDLSVVELLGEQPLVEEELELPQTPGHLLLGALSVIAGWVARPERAW